MELDKYQQAWKSDASQTRVSINADLLAIEVQRTQRDFQSMIFWRDVREVGTSLVMIPVWFVVLVLVRDVTIFLAGIYLRKRTGVLVQSNYTGKAAVVTIGFTLLMALYRTDVSDAVFTGMLALSVAMQAASLIGYGKRFFSLITTSRND